MAIDFGQQRIVSQSTLGYVHSAATEAITQNRRVLFLVLESIWRGVLKQTLRVSLREWIFSIFSFIFSFSKAQTADEPLILWS